MKSCPHKKLAQIARQHLHIGTLLRQLLWSQQNRDLHAQSSFATGIRLMTCCLGTSVNNLARVHYGTCIGGRSLSGFAAKVG